MRSSRTLFFASLATLLAAAAFPIACGGGGKSSGSSSGSGGSTSGTMSTSSGGGQGGGLFGDAGDDPVIAVSITPADQVVEVLNGAIPPATQYQAKGQTKGGALVDVSGEWSFDRLDVASINPGSGDFTASGLVGGKGTVTFKSGSLTASTSATVKLHYTSDPQSVPQSIKDQFAQAGTADPAMSLLYPYDHTVFPRGLTGPTMQWNGGGPTDTYYIHATSPTFEFEAWTAVPPPSRYDFPTGAADVWKKLTDSTSGDITVSIQRHDGAQPYLPLTRTWTIAPANLTGIIYFWEVNSGAVVRLKPGDKQPENFLQQPAGVSCVACHSVSKNGNTIVGAFNGSASPWGTFDAASGASLFVSGTDPNNGPGGSGFQAISPDGSLVLYGQERALSYLLLSPYNSGAVITTLNPGTGQPVHPAWSGDGAHIGFGVRTDGDWLNFTASSLWIADFDATSNVFGNMHQIVGGDANRPVITYPTFSPNSQWIAFERANYSRSRELSIPKFGQSDIWLTSIDGSLQIPLDKANGTGLLQGPEASSTYEPTFMPVAVGGYFWLVVVSERTYGNTLTDTNPASRHKQLWVTAIDASPMPGVDPSHPAFWLPGQELNNNNMRGEWALSPCKQIGQSCTAGYDCCAGFCHDDGMGNLTCTDQGGSCSQIGEACKTAADCCDPKAECIGGFCANNVPG
jgi:hypothetical protein